MSVKIKSLTPEQEARFPELVNQWTQIGFSTRPADRPLAEAAVRETYVRAGFLAPKEVVWCGSPLSLMLMHGTKIMSAMGDSITSGLRDKVWRTVGNKVAAKVSTEVRDAVRSNVWAKVHFQIQGVATGVLGSVMESVCGSVGDDRGAGLDGVVDNAVVFGQHEVPRLAFFDYFSEVVGLTPQIQRLSGLWGLAQYAGWVLPHQNICWISERHHVLECDERARLHSLTGPACAYPDGFAIYSVHGVRVPAFVVERPREITVARIDDEENAEVRRIMIERYRVGELIEGAAAFMRDAGGVVLDHDGKCGTLWRREIPDDEPIVLLEVVNATPEPDGHSKHYWLRVPPTIKTAREAAAWTFDLSSEEYRPEVET